MRKRLPSLESLRILEACVRHRNFTRAAREIGLTSAAVSLRIRNLEAELGSKLFTRSGPRLVATETAHQLSSSVAEALRVVRSAVESSRARPEALRVTSVPSFAGRWLAQRLAGYHALHGDAPIKVDASKALRTGEDFDIAIRTGSGHWSDFDITPLMPVEATPMLSPRLAARVELSSSADLAKLPLLPHDDWPRWFREANAGQPTLRYCADEYPTHELDALAAANGAGVALLCPTLYRPLISDGTLVQPFAHVLRGPVWHYMLAKRGDLRPQVQTFRSWLQQEIEGAPHA
ncbi:MAG: LysR substrate-binding domain-containing protein [Steroidobacteraceae bacterium]